ncbi:MAG: PAS domain S-box protein [Pseudomonadota bacterium]
MTKIINTPKKHSQSSNVRLTTSTKGLPGEAKPGHGRKDDPLKGEGLYRKLVETMNDGLIVVDQKGVITYVNNKFCEISGYSRGELIDHPVIDFFEDSSGKMLIEQGLRLRKGENVSYEITWLTKGGHRVFSIQSSAPLMDANGGFRGSFAVVTDITKQKKAEEALREREKHFRSLLQTAGSAIILLSPERKILEFNKEAERIYGYEKEEVLGKDYVELVFPEEEREVQAEIIDRILNGEALRGFENVVRARDGTEREMLWNAIPWFDAEGRTIGCIGIGIDITRQKKIEKALRESEKKLRHLSSELLNAQEKERKRISIELHDELGQSLTTLKLQLRAIETKLGRALYPLKRDWTEAFRSLDQVIKNTRNLSRGLSPIILEDLGLTSTLKWLIDDFSRRCNIECSVNLINLDDFFMPEAQIVIYRIFQECLVNIAKHANATQVSIVVKDNGDSFSFYIKDNGKGFEIEEVSQRNTKATGMGFVVMEERVNMLRGCLELISQKGFGTTVNISLPKIRKEIDNATLSFGTC